MRNERYHMKLFKKLTAALIAGTFIFGLTACGSESKIYYERNWAEAEVTPYTETCVYKVKYLTDFDEDGYSYKSSDKIGCKIEVSDDSGYVTETSLVTASSLPEEARKNVDSSYDKPVYKITTDLKINIKYTVKEEEMSFNDKVTSTVYFYNFQEGFTPLYSEKSFDTTSYSTMERVLRYVYSYSISYSGKKANYKITDLSDSAVKYDYNNYLLSKVSGSEGSFDTTDYSIDNEELLFAARNLPETATTDISVSSMSYGAVKKIRVAKLSDYTYTDEFFSVNGVKTAEGIKAVKKTIGLTDTTYTGSPIIATYSSGEIKLGEDGSSVRKECFLLKAVTRLPSYTGAMAYILDSVTITK